MAISDIMLHRIKFTHFFEDTRYHPVSRETYLRRYAGRIRRREKTIRQQTHKINEILYHSVPLSQPTETDWGALRVCSTEAEAAANNIREIYKVIDAFTYGPPLPPGEMTYSERCYHYPERGLL